MHCIVLVHIKGWSNTLWRAKATHYLSKLASYECNSHFPRYCIFTRALFLLHVPSKRVATMLYCSSLHHKFCYNWDCCIDVWMNKRFIAFSYVWQVGSNLSHLHATGRDLSITILRLAGYSSSSSFCQQRLVWDNRGSTGYNEISMIPIFTGNRRKMYHPKIVLHDALFPLLLQVKKRSEEKSSFCIGSTQLQFAVGEAVIVAIVWAINTSGLVQCNKHMGSWLSSPC